MYLSIAHSESNGDAAGSQPAPCNLSFTQRYSATSGDRTEADGECRRSSHRPPSNNWLRIPSLDGIEHVRRRSPHAMPHRAATLGTERSLEANRSLRQAEFRSGRSCARQALLRLEKRKRRWSPGHPDPPLPLIGRLPSRAPSWPAGYVGSITHSSNWVWAAVAANRQIHAIGIDTEPVADAKVARQVADCIGDTSEWELLGSALSWPAEAIFSLMFSAKETFYKLYQPLIGLSFDFLDVCLTGSPRADVTKSGIVGNLQLQFSLQITQEYRTTIARISDKINLSEPLEVQFQWTGPDLFTLAWLTADTAHRTKHQPAETEENRR
jgi:enterobactin synthetase component D